MDAAPGETTLGTGRLAAWVEDGEPGSPRPDRERWRAVLARTAARPAVQAASRWSAAAGVLGLVGAGSLAALAGGRLDLGAYGTVGLLSALAAACAPAVLCLRLAVPSPGRAAVDGSSAGWKADGRARGRVPPEQVAEGRREAREGPPSPEAGGRPAMRRHARIRPRQTRTFIATEDGRRLNAQIVDVSQSGVAIEGNLPGLWIGAMVKVGSRRAKAVRVLPRGMAFEFSAPIAAEALTVDLVL